MSRLQKSHLLPQPRLLSSCGLTPWRLWLPADTLSINHNWLNGWNLHWGLRLLQREHAEAAAAIEDCR